MIRNLLAVVIFLILPLTALLSIPPVPDEPSSSELYEGQSVGKITVLMENLPHGVAFHQDRILAKLRTKVGDPFSQLTFDYDLKALSEEYDRAVPSIETRRGEVSIVIQLWQKPTIRAILWHGNAKVSTRKLQKELGIPVHTVFHRDAFNKAFSALKEFYMKKGYFEAELEYRLIPYGNTNEVDIEITVHEGNSGHIRKISFAGLTRQEQSAILELMATKRYNFFTSWLTGSGTYHEEALEHDKLVIVNFLQNEGFADARVKIRLKETREGRLDIHIAADKGEPYHFGEIRISGNTLLTEEQIRKVLLVKTTSPFSPDKLRDSLQNVRDLYGKDGYIETDVNYTLQLSRNAPVYNVEIQVQEGEQFRIGMIRVLGNYSTNKNVILRESLLVPGEVFDSRRLRATEERLEAMGYFKSVNVYPVKTPEDQELGENYRDVIIEVEETTTGSLSLFFGFSSVDSLIGGLELAENNFDHRGLTKWWREGLSSFRGAGEYARARAQIGKKLQSYTLTWMDPYFRDTLWRFGFDLNYSRTGVQSDDYHVNSLGGSLFGSYPLTNYWTYGWKLRARNSVIHIHGIETAQAQRERQNSGVVAGLGHSISYDSIDNPFKPRRGFHGGVEGELAGVRRHDAHQTMFPFAKLEYVNRYYYSVWSKGTVKVRWDLRFVYPFGLGTADLVPLNERFFLGGETTVRGYRSYCLGPHFRKANQEEKDDPTGGISSALVSIEYNQKLLKMLDVFVFMDGGSVSLKQFDIATLRMSWGFGTRIELANRIPITLGLGFPINPQPRFVKLRSNGSKKYDRNADVQHPFFSMGGQF